MVSAPVTSWICFRSRPDRPPCVDDALHAVVVDEEWHGGEFHLDTDQQVGGQAAFDNLAEDVQTWSDSSTAATATGSNGSGHGYGGDGAGQPTQFGCETKSVQF